MQKNFWNKDFRNKEMVSANKQYQGGKMEKITFRGNAYLALQSNSEKLNEHLFFFVTGSILLWKSFPETTKHAIGETDKQRKLFKEMKTTILVWSIERVTVEHIRWHQVNKILLWTTFLAIFKNIC